MTITPWDVSQWTRALAALGVCTLPACGAPQSNLPRSRNESAPPTAAWEAPLGTHSVLSNGGAWRVVYRTEPDPPPRGELFSVDAWICDAREPDRPREDVGLEIDAAMPQHQHGMNRVPTLARMDSGGSRAQGLLFHMPGRWELYFDVTQGAVTERAQVEILVE